VDPETGRRQAVAEPRQRWRVTFGRGAGAPATTHRELADTWSAALAARLPLPRSEGSRQRPPLTFAAPLPVGVTAECEMADLYLAERLPAWRVRQAVCESAPSGVAVAGVHDVWLGAPALAASAAAADYRVVLAGDAACDPAAIRNAAAHLLSATTLERRRRRGNDSVAYDLRPLLDAIDVKAAVPVVLLIRTRFHAERGAGRPEEVLAALADAVGTPLAAAQIVRERILLIEEIAGDQGLAGRFDARPA
jgi:radical SAM-linked protein